MELLNHGEKLLHILRPVTDFLIKNNKDIVVPETDLSKPFGDITETFAECRKHFSKINPEILQEFELKVADNLIKKGERSTFCLSSGEISVAGNQGVNDAVLSVGHELGHSVSMPTFFGDDYIDVYAEIPSHATERKLCGVMGLSKYNTCDHEIIRHLQWDSHLIDMNPNSRHVDEDLPYYIGGLFAVLVPHEELDHLYDKNYNQLQGIISQIMADENRAIKTVEDYINIDK